MDVSSGVHIIQGIPVNYFQKCIVILMEIDVSIFPARSVHILYNLYSKGKVSRRLSALLSYIN